MFDPLLLHPLSHPFRVSILPHPDGEDPFGEELISFIIRALRGKLPMFIGWILWIFKSGSLLRFHCMHVSFLALVLRRGRAARRTTRR